MDQLHRAIEEKNVNKTMELLTLDNLNTYLPDLTYLIGIDI